MSEQTSIQEVALLSSSKIIFLVSGFNKLYEPNHISDLWLLSSNSYGVKSTQRTKKLKSMVLILLWTIAGKAHIDPKATGRELTGWRQKLEGQMV